MNLNAYPLINAGLGKRLMFGSDQMRWPEMIGKGIEAMEGADFLSAEQKWTSSTTMPQHFFGLIKNQ